MGSINFLEKSYEINKVTESVEDKIVGDRYYNYIEEITKEVVINNKEIISNSSNKNEKKSLLYNQIINIIDDKKIKIEGESRETLIKSIIDEILGYGIIQKYIEDPTVNDIMVNDYRNIFIRRGMEDIKVPETFYSEKKFEDFLYKVCSFIGEKLNSTSPKVDGTDSQFNLRINITTSPINTYSPSLIIRKNHSTNVDINKVITPESCDIDVYNSIEILREAGCRIIVAGPLESGKTTWLNAYLEGVKDERIIIMEDTPEMVISNPNTIYQQTVEGKDQDVLKITLQDLVKNFKRTNGTFPVVSEVRGIESVELLDIFNAGFVKGATSIHANSPKEVIRQLVFQIKSSNRLGTDRFELEEYIARTIDIIVYMEKRKIVSISEVVFNEKTERLEIIDLHRFYIEKETKNEIIGHYETCLNPFSDKMLDRIRRAGLLDKVPNKMLRKRE